MFLLGLMLAAAYQDLPDPEWTPHVGEFMAAGLKVAQVCYCMIHPQGTRNTCPTFSNSGTHLENMNILP